MILPDTSQGYLFSEYAPRGGPRQYRPVLTATENGKGVLDVDTVKGCACGMSAYPKGGCYGECYARKGAARSGINFAVAVSRRLTPSGRVDAYCTVRNHRATWYRIGVSGDPSHDWENTLAVCEYLKPTGKVPVVITKHWRTLTGADVARFAAVSAVFNTSLSGMDTDQEIQHRVRQMHRLREAGMVSACRVITCRYGNTAWGNAARAKQDYLLSLGDIIDTPLRATKSNERVLSGDILLSRIEWAVGWKHISLHRDDVFMGTCDKCPDQCGVPKISPENKTT